MEHRRHARPSQSDGHHRPSRERAEAAPLSAVDVPPEIESFHEWELAPEVLASLDGSGITKPTPIQRLAIGPALDGYDVIAKAETGTGKTIAFGAPLMTRIDAQRKTILALVMTPTRELAQQVAGVLQDLGRDRGIKVALVVGGEEMEPQILALRAGAQVVVGTPGRILDLHQRKLMSFPWTEFAILDEADEMLEIGFLPDVEKILSRLPEERQTMLFSATFPAPLLKLAREHTRDPVEVATAAGVKTVDTIRQSWMRVADEDRPLALLRLIEQSADDDVFLVFCDRRTDVDVLFRRMARAPYPIKALHGGYDQPARFRVMTAFRNREVKALIATDVASRGLDVAHVTHVVNYAAPRDVSDYTHRIGRTGRAGREGEAVTFVTAKEYARWSRVLRAATWNVPEVSPPERRGRPPERGGEREPRRHVADDAPRRPRAHDDGDARAPRREREREDDRGRRHDEDRPDRDDRRPERDVDPHDRQEPRAPRRHAARDEADHEPRPRREAHRAHDDRDAERPRPARDEARAPRRHADDEDRPARTDHGRRESPAHDRPTHPAPRAAHHRGAHDDAPAHDRAHESRGRSHERREDDAPRERPSSERAPAPRDDDARRPRRPRRGRR